MPKIELSRTLMVRTGESFMPDGKTPCAITEPRGPGVVELSDADAEFAIKAGIGKRAGAEEAQPAALTVAAPEDQSKKPVLKK